jgi:hypothetical protein
VHHFLLLHLHTIAFKIPSHILSSCD